MSVYLYIYIYIYLIYNIGILCIYCCICVHVHVYMYTHLYIIIYKNTYTRAYIMFVRFRNAFSTISVKVKVAGLWPTLSDLMDYTIPEILQDRILD